MCDEENTDFESMSLKDLVNMGRMNVLSVIKSTLEKE
jgi:hypothetical protein